MRHIDFIVRVPFRIRHRVTAARLCGVFPFSLLPLCLLLLRRVLFLFLHFFFHFFFLFLFLHFFFHIFFLFLHLFFLFLAA